MRQSLKISLSFLISILIFSAFAIVSFTGFFTVIETSFFQPRINNRIEQQLLEYYRQISEYHRLNIERFSGLLDKGFVWTAFARDQSSYEQEIKDRENEFGKLLEAYPGLQLVRFVGPEGRNIHYSTAEQDIISRSPLLKYRSMDSQDFPGGAEKVLVSEKDMPPRVILDGENSRFIYSFPVVDGVQDRYLGSALFYISQTELSNRLLAVTGLDFRELFLLGEGGIVINFPVGRRELLATSVMEIWARQSGSELFSEILPIYDDENARINYRLFGRDSEEYGFITLFVPLSIFQLQPLMQAVILASFFLTVFLIVFLIFNLKQDPLLVLTQRIKRFQLQILQEYMEGKERVDWERWRRELTASRVELKTRIKKGIGKVAPQREAELDSLIDKSWDEIIAVIGARGTEPELERIDIARVEELIQKALDRGKITLSAQEVSVVPTSLSPEVPVVVSPRARKSIVVEEIGVDEVLDSGEVVPPGELEAAEVLEELEEAEAVPPGELEAAEAVPPGELEEAEAVPPGELEAAEAVEEAVQEIEELEELEIVPEIQTLPPEPQEKLEMLPLAEEERKPSEEPVTVKEVPEVAIQPEEKPEKVQVLPPIKDEEQELIKRQIEVLLEKGKIKTYSLDELAAVVEKQRTAVVIENGIYRIKEEIYAKGKPTRGLMALAESIRFGEDGAISVGAERGEVREGVPAEAVGRDETDIGELLGLGDNLDLLTEISELPEWDAAQQILLKRRARSRLELAENGLDYQGYLAQFKDLQTETGKLRSLVELSSKIKAMSAAVMVKSGDVYMPSLKIGLIDDPEKLQFNAGEAFYKAFLEERKVVFINDNLESVRALAPKFNAEDLQYLRGAIFIPAVYDEKEALLFLGIPLKKAFDLKELVSSLNIFGRKN